MAERTDAQRRADELDEEGAQKANAGDEDGALALYLEALALDHARPDTLYNVGLRYKYRREWEKSLRYNRLACELRPDDEATNWNLAIAATALKDWRSAREAWKRLGIRIEEGDGPILDNFGTTPVRLNGFEDADSAVEVVWTRRLSPVTARILNIPTPEARFRFGDVVLHDGAGTGSRFDADGREKAVFNVFELFEPSDWITYDVQIEAPDKESVGALRAACEAADLEFEDWSNLRMLCKACSENRPHEQHEHRRADDEGWQTTRRVGIAAKSFDPVGAVLESWCAGDERRGATIDQDE